MNLKGLDLIEILKRCGIYQEIDIPPYTQSLIDEIIAKPRINKEMPKIIVSSTPKHSQDFLDAQLCGYSVYDEFDYYPSLEYQLTKCKPKERRRIRRKMRKRNKLNQELNKHNRIILDDWIGIEDNTGRKYAVQVKQGKQA